MQEWETVPSMRTKRTGCAAVVQGQHVYVLGGFNGNCNLETVERLDIATGQWEAVPSMHTKRTGCAAVVQGQHVYVLGGHDGSRNLETVERLDTATGQWEAVPSMRTKRTGCAAVVQGQHVYVLGGRDGSRELETGQHVYVLGGFNGSRDLETVEHLDTATGQWEAVPSMRNKRLECAAVVQGQHVYVLGGFDGSRVLETVECLDTATGQWEAVPSMRTKRFGCAAVVRRMSMRLAGVTEAVSCEKVERPAPPPRAREALSHMRTQAYREAVPSMRTKRNGCAAVVQGQHVYVLGGSDGSHVLETVERLDTATGQWEAVPSMRTERYACAAVVQGQQCLLGGGAEHAHQALRVRGGGAGQHVYVLGGYDKSGSRVLETVERLDTATGQWEAVPSMRTMRYECAAVVQGQHVYVLGGSSDLSPRNGQLDTVERSRLITAGEDVGGSTPSVVSLAELDELYHQLRGLRLSAAPRQRLPADAAHLLEQLQRREEQAPLLEGASVPLDSALLEGGTLRAMQDTWRAAQRVVRDVAAGECSLQQECPSAALQEAARERDVVRQEYTCALQAALQQWETQLPEDTIAERTTWLQEQVDSWRGVMGPMGEASGGHASSGAAAPVGAAMETNDVSHASAAVARDSALAQYATWERAQERNQWVDATEEAVGVLRMQLQRLFFTSGAAARPAAGDTAAALGAGMERLTAAVHAERSFWESDRMQDAPPVDALRAAGAAVLAQLEQEALVMRQVSSQLTAMRRDHQELERMGAAQVGGEPEEAVTRLGEASRSVKKLRRQLGRRRFDLEEAMEGSPPDETVVAVRQAKVEEVKAEVRVAQERVHVAFCGMAALEGQFPELMRHMQQAVPPELLALWRPDQDLEETFDRMAIHTLVGARHQVAKVTDADGQHYAVKQFVITDSDAEALKVFWKEASRLHRMRHPAIAPILGIFMSRRGVNATDYGIQMPWYAHGQLDQWKAAQQPEEAVVRRGMLRVLEAVAHLHHARVVHCDIKPANILVDSAGRPHLLDFDISMSTATRTTTVRHTALSSDAVQGTEGYLAPEITRTGHTKATDMYAFGVTLREVAPVEELRGADLCDLLQGLTAQHPDRRLSAAEACQHPYFSEVWAWQREETRRCCVAAERSTCGGRQHQLTGGLECSSRLPAGPHFVCSGCLAAHVQASGERDGRIGCPCKHQDPNECDSCDYTDAELCRHLPLTDYQNYLTSRQRCMEEMMAQEMEARRVEDMRREVQQLQACKVCLDREIDRVVMDCGHACLCSACLDGIMGMGQQYRKCPVCRGDIRQCHRVFIA
ncbi:hypothetical protein CYMTET_53617 [Cymbomonas tetramitiformis]|uniref:RING-type domain-containing protein n=1 Tax=Cymbomonas tetramitiformis TaxID=36881 RepID=A0AAE0EPJ2_9CHLO|nr:hypothetical protein CYMTET_53617 [Cymbomonas tetramitiformis]